jgi:hypothetical protein
MLTVIDSARPARRRRDDRILRRAAGLLAVTVAGLCLLLSASLPVRAEKADRDKPINIEADRVEVDDVKQESVFIGNVQITQGTLIIRGDRVVVSGLKNRILAGLSPLMPRGLVLAGIARLQAKRRGA